MPDPADESCDVRSKHKVDLLTATLADNQHGVVALLQLADLGLSRYAIHRRVAAGRLHVVERCVYAVGRPTLTRKGHWMAAVVSRRTRPRWPLRPPRA